MPIVECLHCQAQLEAPAEYRGRLVKCSMCGKSFVLRFTGHDLPAIARKAACGQSKKTPELKSTVEFRLLDNPAPAPAEPKAAPEMQRKKKPHRKS